MQAYMAARTVELFAHVVSSFDNCNAEFPTEPTIYCSYRSITSRNFLSALLPAQELPALAFANLRADCRQFFSRFRNSVTGVDAARP